MTLDLLDETLLFVQNHIHPQKIALPDWKMKDGDSHGAYHPKFNDKSWRIIQTPFQWGGYDKMAWFRREVSVPQEFSGKPIVLLIDLPESLLYLNGSPYHGIDAQHQELFLTAKARGNQQYSVSIQSYSGRKIAPSSFHNAELAVLYTPARSLYYTLKTLRELAHLFGTSTPEGKDLREIIRRTLIFLKYFKPEGEEYPHAIGRALNFLLSALGTEFTTNIPGLAHLVGSAYAGTAASWTIKECERKTTEIFSTVNQLMEEYPELVFGLGQAHLYQLVERQYTELGKAVKQRVTEGRWELLGGMWAEPDCNIPSGESLVRQILYGKRYFRQVFGREVDIAWLPDSNGFNGNLPQILSKSGFKFFVASKLLMNETTRFPFQTFWWQGIDRSRILSFIPPLAPEQFSTAKDLKKSWDAFVQKETAQDYLLIYGYGDGKAGPTKEHLEVMRVFKNVPGAPKTRSSSVWEFFKQAEEQTKEVPTWVNELYLEKHRGTYTTNASVKSQNRRCETALANAEVLATLVTLAGAPASRRKYPQEDIANAWKQLLTLQDRNVISGAAIADAYDDVHALFQSIEEASTHLINRTANSLTEAPKQRGSQSYFTLFNPLSWVRSDYVVLSMKSNEKLFTVLDDKGTEIEHQVIEKRKNKVSILCYVRNLLPQSFGTLTVYPGAAKAGSNGHWKISQKIIESPFYKIRLDKNGAISSLYDKEQRRELIKKGKRGNILQTFVDEPKQWEAWDIDAEYQSKQTRLFHLRSARIIEQGPLRAVVRLEFRSSGTSRLTQDMILYHQHRRIDFVTNVRWFEQQTLLKATFPVDIKSHLPTYEIQFGAITRTSRQTNPQDKAKFEVPALRWADLSDARGGVSLLNNCKYGYDTNESTMRLTLLRSAHFAHPLDPAKATDNRLSDQGEHQFTYALLPHKGDWRKSETVRHAGELNSPLLVFPDRIARRIPPLVSSTHASIVIDTIKKAEDSDDIILRLYEAHGEKRDTTLEFGFPVLKAFECDLMETVLNNLKASKSKLRIKLKPFEIKTLKVALKPQPARK